MAAARSYMGLIGNDSEDSITSLPNYLKNNYFIVIQGLQYSKKNGLRCLHHLQILSWNLGILSYPDHRLRLQYILEESKFYGLKKMRQAFLNFNRRLCSSALIY